MIQVKILYFIKVCLIVSFFILLSYPSYSEKRADPFTREFFEQGKKIIKSRFVGRDEEIDLIFQPIRTWYLHPQARNGPVITCLWSLTGQGKTSLVKTIVEALNLKVGFLKVEIEQFSRNGDENVVYRILKNFTLRDSSKEGLILTRLQIPDNPILLFDEIQTAASKDQRGQPIDRPLMQQFWELLGNDGIIQVQNPAYADLNRMLENPNSFIKVPVGLTDLNEITEYRKNMLEEARTLFETTPQQIELNLSGSLVFINGNLDHVFEGSNVIDPDSYSAKDLNRITRRITPADIKSGLGEIFFPRQVSRFGNRHIILSTPNKRNYREIIMVQLRDLQAYASRSLGIDLTFSDRFVDRIYSEGVVPSQGIRPVKDTVNAFAKDHLGLVQAYLEDNIPQMEVRNTSPPHHPTTTTTTTASSLSTAIHIDISSGGKKSVWTIKNGSLKGKKLRFSVTTEGLKATRPYKGDHRYVTAVHEAGHATVLIALTNELPKQIRSRTRRFDAGGYVQTKDRPFGQRVIFKRDLINQIVIFFAGYEAEKLVFGDVSMGPGKDIEQATSIARDIITKFAMGDGSIHKHMVLSREGVKSDDAAIVDEVNKILNEARELARKILHREEAFWRALSHELTEVTHLKSKDIAQLVEAHWSKKKHVPFIIGEKSPKASACEGAYDRWRQSG